MYDSRAGTEEVSLTSNRTRIADLFYNTFNILKDKMFIKKTKMKGYKLGRWFRRFRFKL